MKRKRISKARTLLVILFVLLSSSMRAHLPGSHSSDSFGWYMGLEGGTAFGVSTLSSFGADKTRSGFTAGLYGGYQINQIFSVELAAKWGKLPMSARECCVDADNWLSVSGHQYVAEVLGEKGEYMSQLKGDAAWQNYAFRLHVNVLGFVPSLQDSPWRVEMTPQFSFWCSNDKVKNQVTGEAFHQYKPNDLCLGYGGSMQVSYQFQSGLSLGVFSGITFLNGDRLDGLVKKHHKNNFVWESGMRLGWKFHKK